VSVLQCPTSLGIIDTVLNNRSMQFFIIRLHVGEVVEYDMQLI